MQERGILLGEKLLYDPMAVIAEGDAWGMKVDPTLEAFVHGSGADG